MEGFLEEFLPELQKLEPWGTRGTQIFNFSEPNFLNKSWCRKWQAWGRFPGGREQKGSRALGTSAAQNVRLLKEGSSPHTKDTLAEGKFTHGGKCIINKEGSGIVWQTVRFLGLVAWAQRDFSHTSGDPGRFLVLYKTTQELCQNCQTGQGPWPPSPVESTP